MLYVIVVFLISATLQDIYFILFYSINFMSISTIIWLNKKNNFNKYLLNTIK
jgi:hypothetical protein